MTNETLTLTQLADLSTMREEVIRQQRYALFADLLDEIATAPLMRVLATR